MLGLIFILMFFMLPRKVPDFYENVERQKRRIERTQEKQQFGRSNIQGEIRHRWILVRDMWHYRGCWIDGEITYRRRPPVAAGVSIGIAGSLASTVLNEPRWTIISVIAALVVMTATTLPSRVKGDVAQSAEWDTMLSKIQSAPGTADEAVSFAHTFNIMNAPYNAKSDGSDSTTAINSAFTDAGAVGGVVSMPPRTFTTAGTILPKTNTTWQGSGRGGTFINYTGSGIAVDIGDNTADVSLIVIKDVIILLAATSTNGIRARRLFYSTFDNVQVNGPAAATAIGILLDGGANFCATNRILGCRVHNIWKCVKLTGSGGASSTNHTIILGGLYIANSAANSNCILIDVGDTNMIIAPDMDGAAIALEFNSSRNKALFPRFESPTKAIQFDVGTNENVVLYPHWGSSGTTYTNNGSGNIVKAQVPLSVSAIVPGASPFTYTNSDATEELILLDGARGAAGTLTVTKNAIIVYSIGNSEKFHLAVDCWPGENIIVTYTSGGGDTLTMNKDQK